MDPSANHIFTHTPIHDGLICAHKRNGLFDARAILCTKIETYINPVDLKPNKHGSAPEKVPQILWLLKGATRPYKLILWTEGRLPSLRQNQQRPRSLGAQAKDASKLVVHNCYMSSASGGNGQEYMGSCQIMFPLWDLNIIRHPVCHGPKRGP